VVPYGAFQILFGPLGDRIGKLKVVGIALGLSSIPTLYCGLVTSLDGLVLMRFLTGIAMAGTVPLAMAFLADEVPFAERQPVMARYVNGLVLGQIVGGSLGGVAAEYFAWRHIFIVFAALSAAISLCLLWEARQRPAPKHLIGRPTIPVFRTYLALLRQRRSRDIIIIGTVEGVLIFGILAYFGAYLRQAHGYNYALIGVLLGMYGVGGLIYGAAVYRLVRRLGERRMVLIGSSLLGICCVLLCAVPQWWLLGPLFTVAGFGFYMFHNTMQTRASELSDEARGTSVALWVFMLFAGQGVGVVLFGAIIDHLGYASAFIAAGAGIVVLGWWTARLLVRHR
jgi:predicted MFS family arabinose efflux permease